MNIRNQPWLRRRGSALPSILVAAAFLWGAPLASQELQELRTQAENSGFTQFTAYDSMMTYLAEVQARSTEMRLGIYGETHLGRELPYAVFSRPAVTQPWEAWALGKPILVLAAGVHGPERTLRESVLIMTRDFATRGTPMNDLLDDLTIVVVPQINPDGFSNQPNPQRGNLWGLDLNRDYMKLEQPEIQSYVQNVILKWAPHLFIDGHNGGSYPYNINYQCPSHAAPDQRISRLCDEEIFPAIDRKLATEDYLSFYYSSGNQEVWRVGGTEPRIGRNYGGFANTVGILFESPGRQPMADGVRSGVLAYEAVVEWAQGNPELLMTTVQNARLETIALGSQPSGTIAIETSYEAEDFPVTYQITQGQGPDQEIVTVENGVLMKKPVATLERDRPWAYVLPRDAEAAVELLQRHSIQVERLLRPTQVTVQAYTISDVTYAPVYNHSATTRIQVEDVITREMTLPVGSYIVRTGQMQGRVAAHLLEAESTDGVVYWNRMDAWIPKRDVERFKAGDGEAPQFPIVKIMSPAPLSTRLLANGS